jgi:hypothetical protein
LLLPFYVSHIAPRILSVACSLAPQQSLQLDSYCHHLPCGTSLAPHVISTAQGCVLFFRICFSHNNVPRDRCCNSTAASSVTQTGSTSACPAKLDQWHLFQQEAIRVLGLALLNIGGFARNA